MDPAPASLDPQQLASSPEPSSTRPNPFDDSDIASRKRRRTSGSVESSHRVPDTSIISATVVEDSPTGSSDILATMEDDSNTPRTPDQSASAAVDSIDPPSSRVTINLRHAPPDESLPSPSRQPQTHISVTSTHDKNDADRAAESELDLVGDGSSSPSSRSASPPVELVDDHGDEDLGAPVETVSILGRGRYAVDPIERFPYREPHEHIYDTAHRLINHLNTQPIEPAILQEVQQWLASYVEFAQVADAFRLARSLRSNRNFWLIFPDIVLAISNRRPSLLRIPPFRPVIMRLYNEIIHLTVILLRIDVPSLAETEASLAANQPLAPELFSGGFLTQLYYLLRRDTLEPDNESTPSDELGSPGEDNSMLRSKIKGLFGNEPSVLEELTTSLLGMLYAFPKALDSVVPSLQLLSILVDEAILDVTLLPGTQAGYYGRGLLARMYDLWSNASGVLSLLIDKQGPQLNGDALACSIVVLSELLKGSVIGPHDLATKQLTQYQQEYPQLTSQLAAEAIALEWRYDVLGKLIRCSQMQLRVMAVTRMCNELVNLWKRLGEDPENSLLKHVGEYLSRSGLVDYILSPNCHPEIMVESANIVGFLIVAKLYRKEHTNRIWQGITCSQDSRAADAFTRMLMTITNLLDSYFLGDICEKFEKLPLTAFTPSVRTLWGDHIMKLVVTKSRQDRVPLAYQPYNLCLRLLRESSICTNGTDIGHPDMQQLAMQKLRDLLTCGPDDAGRAELYQSCLDDVGKKTQTALGSLWCLLIAIRNTPAHEMVVLTQQYDLTKLIVEELEHAVQGARSSGAAAVLSGIPNQPRRDFVYNIIRYVPKTLDDHYGKLLWDILVGPLSLCAQDREAGWKILNDIVTKTSCGLENTFVNKCLSQHLPNLPAMYLCEGSLEFVRAEALALVQRSEDFHLDDEDAVRGSCLEQLWKVVLNAGDTALVSQAIRILVVEVYTDSNLVSTYPTSRTRQVHSSLVNRCFQQLKDSSNSLKILRGVNTSEDADTMVTVAADDEVEASERTFVRSLQFLRYFLEAHQSKPRYAIPDLRPLMSRTPSEKIGDSADLKYQSFDGVQQTEVKSLDVGKRNTGASLLATIRQETGFQNYSAYFRGARFLLNEDNVCKCLEDLNIQEGLILVKREEAEQNQVSCKYKPGSSSLQIEIMSHFSEMWEYLDLGERLASEIYSFLIRLPAEIRVIESFEDEQVSYQDIFHPGQPFKTLYSIHALGEHRDIAKRACAVTDEDPLSPIEYNSTRQRAITRLVQAIMDPAVSMHNMRHLELQILQNLMSALIQWLQDLDEEPGKVDIAKLGIHSPERFVAILSHAKSIDDVPPYQLISATYTAIMQLGLWDAEFWKAAAVDPAFVNSIRSCMLFDRRKQVRSSLFHLVSLIADREARVSFDSSTASPADDDYRMTLFFWEMAVDLLDDAVCLPEQCNELFDLLRSLLSKVFLERGNLIDFRGLAVRTSRLLMSYNPTEDIDQLEPADPIPNGLARLLLSCLENDDSIATSDSLHRDLAYELYCRLLFPRTREQVNQPVPKVILNSYTRHLLGEVIFHLVKHDHAKYSMILNSINEVVPFFTKDEEDPYLYEIPFSFDRTRAMRAPCGYVGLRNLSNTCYLNSLLTQLYMHPDFRRFMMSVGVTDPEGAQDTLQFTKKVFGFMQESYRRFVDPDDFVQSIKTYEDTQIDIHNQMDVDEFYNLLFDRWEGQLQTSSEKKKLRSFFGGQLVQQVKSKECEHVSERLEPFSAIQCDIKGKKTLQESLQAYVDGEVLDGDNKYKCSTCDAHVDAVKRACLKDLPDNVIFHLKRFDFNLRTLQRSKINDHFSFPETIDLQPYTVEHLSDPTNDEPDIFELVGILVHAGTAESGHYYSYIRERPSGGDRPTWVEFNDDNVSPWDPSLMETSTFGGPDFRNSFDANSIAYDKPYSAYMLFYQRATSVASMQTDAIRKQETIPVRVDVETRMKEHILDENTHLLRRHCLFDPTYAGWLRKMFEHAATFTEPIDSPDSGSMEVDTMDTDMISGKKLRELAMEVLLSHLDQIFSRKKDLPDFHTIMSTLQNAITQSAEHAYSLYQYFFLRPAAFRTLLLRNTDPEVRGGISHQFLRALRKIYTDLPQYYSSPVLQDLDVDGLAVDRQRSEQAMSSGRHGVPVLGGVMYIFRHLWKYFHIHIRAWDDHFGTICGFAKMGDKEVARLLSDDYLLKLARIIAADSTVDFGTNYAAMLRSILRRMNNRPPSYGQIIATLEHLLMRLSPTIDSESIVDSASERLHADQSPFYWTSVEVQLLHAHPEERNRSWFVEKLLTIDHAPRSTDNIIVRLVQASDTMDLHVLNALRANIHADSTPPLLEPFFRAGKNYVAYTASAPRARRLVTHVSHQAQYLHTVDIPGMLMFFEATLSMPSPESESAPTLHDHCFQTLPQWAPYVLVHPTDNVRRVMLRLLDDQVFKYLPDHDFGEDIQEQASKEVVISTIQRLGVACFLYLRETYLQRKAQISRDQATVILDIARRCEPFFEVPATTVDTESLLVDFDNLHEEIMDSLDQLIVDQIEDNGTDWEGSCASSDQMDGITADIGMQAMNELNDTEAA